jgi:pimeloyl-ACP methyl ester carboxylesterase
MNSQHLSFEISGRGRVPLICVPGWACAASQFEGLSKLLGDTFRIYRLNLPGHGSTPLNDFKPGFEAYARAIVEFSLEQQLERPVLLGHSMGGVLCLMAASRRWDIQPRAVINLDGSLPAAARLAGLYPSLKTLMALPDFREHFTKLARAAFFLDSERDARCEAIIQGMGAAPEAVLRFLPEQAGDLKPEEILPAVQSPVLFVGAAEPRFAADKAAALIPRITCKRIPDAGHFLHIYALNELVSILNQFFQSIAIR